MIGQDLLSQRRITKPALFRQTFELLASFPAQELSLRKILGQLQDHGNTETIRHYLNLFQSVFLFVPLQKFSTNILQKKHSSPKILPVTNAFHCAYHGFTSQKDHETFGRLFESAVGADLYKLPGSLFYWREDNAEVDFVYKEAKNIFAIEVKSNRNRSRKGLELFLTKFKNVHTVFVTMDNYETFSRNPAAFLKSTL